MVLRLLRDLRPRGAIISQLVADAGSQLMLSVTIPTIMASPGLKAEQCERLIRLLVAHEENSVDGYAEGLRTSYILSRSMIEDLVHNQSELAKAFGLKPGESVVRAMITSGDPGGIHGATAPSETQTRDWDSQVAGTSAAEVSRLEKELDRYHRSALALDGLPYARRLERLSALKPPAGSDPLSLALASSLQAETMEAVVRSQSRQSPAFGQSNACWPCAAGSTRIGDRPRAWRQSLQVRASRACRSTLMTASRARWLWQTESC